MEKSPLNENKANKSKNNDSKKVKAKAVVKEERADIELENSEKTKVLKKSLKKSPSPEKVKVKETITPDIKKGTKNVMSFFVKKDVNGKSEGEGKEGGIVAGENLNFCFPFK